MTLYEKGEALAIALFGSALDGTMPTVSDLCAELVKLGLYPEETSIEVLVAIAATLEHRPVRDAPENIAAPWFDLYKGFYRFR